MTSRYERQVRNLTQRDLYPRRKRTSSSSVNGSAESILINSMSATEALLASTNNLNHQNHHPLHHHPHPYQYSSLSSHLHQTPAQSQQQQPFSVHSQYQPFQSSNNLNINNNSNNNNNNNNNNNISASLLKPHQNKDFKRTPSPSRVFLRENVPGTNGTLNGDIGKSAVIVNLNLTGSNLQDKRRLSKLLREVNELRELRDRAESFDAEMSLEAPELNDDDYQFERVGVRRSRNMMLKFLLYDFLKRPVNFAATVYHMFAFILVASCLVLSISPDIEHQIGKMPILEVLEKTVLLWFTVEFLLRLWSSECRPQYKGWRGKIAFMKSPAHLIDLMVIILSAGLPSISSHDGHEVFAFRAFRGFHRFFQILQIIALKRQLRPWSLFWSVLYDQREQLLIIFYLEIVFLCLLSYIVFMVEQEANQQMNNISDAMWWSVVTLTTVGYGDKVPVTWLGKLIACVFILFGVAVFALPAGIIGAGLALKLEEVERSRQRRKKKDAAANLIQKAWKCYKANHDYTQLGTFFRHKPGDIFKFRVYNHILQAFIATVKFHIAKNNFREMTKPVDLRNVIESYKYGQMDVFNRIKSLHSALDIVISRLTTAEQERMNTMNLLVKYFENNNQTFNENDLRQQTNIQTLKHRHGIFLKTDDPSSLLHFPVINNNKANIRNRSDSSQSQNRASTPHPYSPALNFQYHHHSKDNNFTSFPFTDSHHTITTINEMSVPDDDELDELEMFNATRQRFTARQRRHSRAGVIEIVGHNKTEESKSKLNEISDVGPSRNEKNRDKSVEESILEYIKHTKQLNPPLVVEIEDRDGRPISPSDTGLWMALRAIKPLMFQQMMLNEQYWNIDYVAAAHQLSVLEDATSPHDTMYQTTFVLSRKPFKSEEEFNEKSFIRPDVAVQTDQFYSRTCSANILYQFQLHIYQYWALQCYQ